MVDHEVIISHEGKDLVFMPQIELLGTYIGVEEQIKEQRLIAPTFAETISLIYFAFENQHEEWANQILEPFRKKWFWAYTGTLFVPYKGVYVQDNPQIINGKVIMNKSELVKKLKSEKSKTIEGVIFSKDGSVRFVPIGYKIGKHTADDLARNTLLLGLAGEKGRERAVKIAQYFDSKPPQIYSFKDVDEEKTRVCAIGAGCSGGLDIGANDEYDKGEAFAFGYKLKEAA